MSGAPAGASLGSRPLAPIGQQPASVSPTVSHRGSNGGGCAPKTPALVQYLHYYWTTFRINIHEAKSHLSRYIERLLKGEVILLCKRNVPIAEIRGLPPRRTEPRPVGLDRGRLAVPKSFFEPLPDDLVDGFRGSSP